MVSDEKDSIDDCCGNVRFRLHITDSGVCDTANGGDPPECACCIWRNVDIQWITHRH